MAQKSSGKGDWGVTAIGARSVWDAYGITGKGERIGVIDTGIDPANADLAGKIAAWHDFVNGRATPYDDGAHGTHVAGTLVGGAAGGGAIGVAPGATLVVAKALDATGVGNGSALIAAAQWMMDPDGNPATADYPTVISNSWVSPGRRPTPGSCRWCGLARARHRPGVRGRQRRWQRHRSAARRATPRASPSAPSTTTSPRATSRRRARSPGPTVNDEGLAPGTLVGKPDFVAPGEDVMSSVPGGYAADVRHLDGAPHVAARRRAAAAGRPDADRRPGHRHARGTARDLGRCRPRQPVTAPAWSTCSRPSGPCSARLRPPRS